MSVARLRSMYQRIPDLEKQERADQSQNVLQSTSNVCNVSIFAVFVNRLAASMVGCTELRRWIVWTLTLDHMPELFRWDCNATYSQDDCLPFACAALPLFRNEPSNCRHAAVVRRRATAHMNHSNILAKQTPNDATLHIHTCMHRSSHSWGAQTQLR